MTPRDHANTRFSQLREIRDNVKDLTLAWSFDTRHRAAGGRRAGGRDDAARGRFVWVTSEREHHVTVIDVAGTPSVAGRIATARRLRALRRE